MLARCLPPFSDAQAHARHPLPHRPPPHTHTGSSGGVTAALSLLRPLGTLVLKSTVSLADATQPQWAALANDIVVNEKVSPWVRQGAVFEPLLCCRCGLLGSRARAAPFPPPWVPLLGGAA